MTELGIYPKDFIGKYFKRSKSFECFNCHLVSPKNYIIECNHCICQNCIIYCNYCNICNGQEICSSGKNPTAFQYISIDTIINPYSLQCIFNPCKWKGTYQSFIKYHYYDCEFKGENKLMDEYFEEFVEELPPKINRKSKSEIKSSKKKSFKLICNLSNSSDDNELYDEKSFNFGCNNYNKTNNYLLNNNKIFNAPIINQKNNYNIINNINNNNYYFDSTLKNKIPIIHLEESIDESCENIEQGKNDEIQEQNKDIEVISLNEEEEEEDNEEEEEDNEEEELYNEFNEDKEDKNRIINDDFESFELLKNIKGQNQLKSHNEINKNYLKQKRKSENINYNFYNENDNNNIYDNDFSILKNFLNNKI